MTDLLIKPKKLAGSIHIPPSKSMAHRAVISAALADGRSIVENIQLSDDIIATIQGMEAFGAVIKEEADGDRIRLTIDGIGNKGSSGKRTIDANESGSTLRFFIPIATLFEGETRFVGRGKLGTRPLDTFEDIFKEQGLRFEPSGTDQLDLKVEGRLQAGHYEMAGNVSSQFITGLLFTLPLLEGDSVIQITTELESVGYLDLTLEVLEKFGIQIDFDRQENRFNIPGQQSYKPTNYKVEGDFSQAAFWLVAGALGNDIRIKGLDMDSKQGDKAIVTILEDLGASIDENEEGIKAQADQLKAGITVDGKQFPDIIPVAALAAAMSEGETIISNLERLRIKESDRLEATASELSQLGAKIVVEGDSLHIEGVDSLVGDAEVWSHKDHRIAMMLGIASTVCQREIIVKDKECVAKSYPTFWEDFKQVGGEWIERNLG